MKKLETNTPFNLNALGDKTLVELKNGRFVDVINGSYYDAGTRLIIQGNKIFAMPGLDSKPKDVQPDLTIDLQGKTVIPGLFNTHSHLGLILSSLLTTPLDLVINRKYRIKQIEINMADCLARGITHLRDTWTEDLNLTKKLGEKIFQSELPGPRIYQSLLISPVGGTFAPKRGVLDKIMFTMAGMPCLDYENPHSGVVTFPQNAAGGQIRTAVDKAVEERGAQFIKIYDQRETRLTFKPGAAIMTMEQLEAVTDQARKRGIRTTMHHLTVESFRRGIQAGVSSLAHLPCDAELRNEDISAFNGSGCILEPTLSTAYYLCWKLKGDTYLSHPRLDILNSYRKTTKETFARFWLPELRNSFRQGLEKCRSGKMKLFGLLDVSKVFRYHSGLITHGVSNLQKLAVQGALIACANDAGAVPATQGMIGQELEIIRLFLNEPGSEVNFSGAEALKTATINSASALGLEKDFGSIETGKTADLAVLNGNPLEDFRLIGSPVAALFMDGKLVVNNCGLHLEREH